MMIWQNYCIIHIIDIVNSVQCNLTRLFCDSKESSKLTFFLTVCQAWSYLGGPRRWDQEEISKHCTRQNKRTSHGGLSCWWGRGWIFWWTVLAADICCLRYLTCLWCWAYPKVPDLPELHCNCDTGMLILAWQLLGTKKKEKEHDCTFHLETPLDFISYLGGASSGPCLQFMGKKKWGKFLLKAQLKRKPKLWSDALGLGRVAQNLKCWISVPDTFLSPIICLWFLLS